MKVFTILLVVSVAFLAGFSAFWKAAETNLTGACDKLTHTCEGGIGVSTDWYSIVAIAAGTLLLVAIPTAAHFGIDLIKLSAANETPKN